LNLEEIEKSFNHGDTPSPEVFDKLIAVAKAAEMYSKKLYEHWDHSTHARDCDLSNRGDECTCYADVVLETFQKIELTLAALEEIK